MTLKEKLISNRVTIGSWITIGHPVIAEIMCAAKFDWLTIDMEHSAIELSSAQQLIMSIDSYNMPSLVRVPKNEEVIIKRVMDAGAHGVIIPMINTKEDAIKAIEFTKYPPKGKRGVGLSRAQKYGYGFKDYKEWLEKESIIIGQIEHIEGVKNVESIIQLDEIDGIMIGPYDLSGSLGFPGEFERKEFIEAITEVEHACRKRSKVLGFHVINPSAEELNEKIRKGYTFLGFSLDFLFIGAKIREELIKIK